MKIQQLLPRWEHRKGQKWPTRVERESTESKENGAAVRRDMLKRGERRTEGMRETGREEEETGRQREADDSSVAGEVRIKIQISQPGKNPHFEVRRAQWANMNTLQRVCIQPRAGNTFY